MAHMRRGDFESAWRISDSVLAPRAGYRCDHLPQDEQWLWDGRPLEGKRVMVRCFHGLGDTIQFIRYAKLLAVLARSVTLVAQPKLVPLVRTMNSGFNPLFRCRGVAVVGDVEVKLMELPHVFRTTFATIPCEIPYFDVNPKQFPQNALLNVGLVWKSGVWDKRRSVPFELVRRLGAIGGVNWYILQRGEALGEWDGGFGVNSGSDDVLEAARVIAGLDLLISVDSMPAHLGGSGCRLGRCCIATLIGDGCSVAASRLGIRPCDYFDKRVPVTGSLSLRGSGKRCARESPPITTIEVMID